MIFRRYKDMRVYKGSFLLAVLFVLGVALPGCVWWGSYRPKAPSGVHARALTPRSVSVAWNLVSDATSYRIFLEEGSARTRRLAAVITSNDGMAVLSGLLPDTAYRIRIVAYHRNIEGARSVPVEITTPAASISELPAPMDVRATLQTIYDRQHTIGGRAVRGFSAWVNITWSEVPGAVRYEVYYRLMSQEGRHVRTPLRGVTTNSTVHEIDFVANGETIRYFVTAVNSSGEEGPAIGRPSDVSAVRFRF
jgi:hypothetical protein